MRRGPILAAIIAAAGLVCAGAAWAWSSGTVTATSTGASNAATWTTRAQACRQAHPSTDELDFGYRDCIADLWTQAAREGTLPAISVAFTRLEADGSVTSGECHQAAHAAGRTEAGSNLPLTALLANAGTGSCGGGYLHGLMEGFADAGRSFDQLVQIAVGCSTLTATMDAFNCAHGLGHAGWESTGSLTTGAVVCAHIRPDLQSYCQRGVIMSSTSEARLTDHSPNPITDPGILIDACERLSSAGMFAPVVNGCVAGTGVAAAAPAGHDVTRWNLQKSGRQTGAPVTLDDLRAQYAQALSVCAQFPQTDDQRVCRHELASEIPQHLPGDDDLPAICALLPDDLTAYCLHTRIDPLVTGDQQATAGDRRFDALIETTAGTAS